jgi:hypothetical protein
MRRVEHVGVLPRQDEGYRDLFADRIRARPVDDGAEVPAQLVGGRAVPLLAEQDVLGLAIDPGQVAQQVPDVRADAEVTEFAGVDRDAHGAFIIACRMARAAGR